MYIVLHNIKTEIILYCREYNGPVIVASPDGGVDIEEVAEKTPERIMKVPVDIKIGTGLTNLWIVDLFFNRQCQVNTTNMIFFKS